MFKGKRSFFTELLFSFLLILCIPIITIMLILWQSDRIVSEQVLDVEDKRLHLYVEQLEEVMGEMKDICHAIYSSEYCKLYATEIGNNTVWAYDLRQKVVNTLQSLDKNHYYDIFVYYYNDRVISGRYSSLKSADYYATYYSELKVDRELEAEFMEILQTDYKKPKCHIINDGTDNSYLCMTMGVKARSSKVGYTICVVLKPSYLDQLIAMQKRNGESILQIYNTDKKFLFSNETDVGNHPIIKSIVWEGKESDTWLSEKEYMIQVKQSSKVDNYYVYAVPRNMFWNTLKLLRIWGYTGAGLCLLISILFSYRSAVRAYQPVNRIMEFLNRRKGNNTTEKVKAEFTHILSFVENQEKILKENKKISREWFLHGLLEGKGQNIDAQTLERNDLAFVGEQFVVCIIQADILNAEMEDLCSFVVQNVLEELCETVGRAYFVDISKNRYALLINIFKDGEGLQEALQKGQEFIGQNFRIVLSIGYSDRHEGIHAITDAYKEAQEAIRYRFLLGSGRLIGYREINARSAAYRNDEASKVYMLLLEYIERNQEGESLDNIDDFVDRIMYIYQVNEEMSVDVALVFRNEIISALGKIMGMCGYEEEMIRKVRARLKNTSTLSDFRQLIIAQITELCKCKWKRKSSADVLEETKRFIEEHYGDSELSVAMIGRCVGMQENHLSKLFKERYGVTMLEYVTSVRIFHAKRLIREEGGSVQEVAEKTGFLSSTVFIRTFKKKEGITPGKYKELAKNE